MAGPDDAAGGVDVEAVFEGREWLRGEEAAVELEEGCVDEVDFAEAGFELGVASVCGFEGDVVGVGGVVDLGSGAGGGSVDAGFAGGGWGAREWGFGAGGGVDEADGGAAVAVFGGDDDDAVGGDGAADVGVSETGAAEAVGEDHGWEAVLGGLGEEGSIGDGGEGDVVEEA